MNICTAGLRAVTLLVLALPASGQEMSKNPDYVSREEYEALKKELDAMKTRLAELEGKTVTESKTQEQIDTLGRELEAVKSLAEGSGLGETKMLIAGDTEVGFTDLHNDHSSFNAEFSPMFLIELNDRLLFQGDLDIELNGPDENGENSETDVELGAAFLSYLINDYSLVGMGLFPVPFTAYHNHFDPGWINKLPTDPLIYGDNGIAPDSAVGVFVTGAFERGISQFNYAAYITNGPALITEDPDSAGSFNFDDYNDTNNNKAVGGRIGYLPIPELEVGYSFQFSDPSPSGFETLHSHLHGIDWNYVASLDSIKGRLTARGAWVWSQLTTATYVLDTAPPRSVRFGNNRNGGYGELAYRPTETEDEILRNFEFVLRYDQLNVPSDAPGGGDRQMWTPGIDYWITPRTVLKTSYQFDDSENGEGDNGFFVQLATGF